MKVMICSDIRFGIILYATRAKGIYDVGRSTGGVNSIDRIRTAYANK